MKTKTIHFLAFGLGTLALFLAPASFGQIIHRTIDIDIGETQQVTLHGGSTALVKLLKVEEQRESVTQMLARATVTVEVNGKRAELVSGNYRLPAMVGGVQVDAPAVRAYMKDTNVDWWGLRKDARIRLWPADSPWIEPGTFLYPARQRWFASMTWYSNEPVSRRPKPAGQVYYHAGMDIGGAEGLIEVVAATEGVVLNRGTESAPGSPHPAAKPRYDVIYVQDSRGWLYRYSHLMAFDPAPRAGGRVKQGQRLGYIGKEGSSGGWTHLHFSVESLQPSGQWGIEDSYAFLWQAYRQQYDPPIIAVARPHQTARVGETVTLDASRTWAKREIRSFEWALMDGTTATGPTVRRIYDRPGQYSEIIKVTDTAGNIDYDFASVRVYTGANPDGTASGVRVHAAYAPTFGIKPGDPVVFRSRGFETPAGADIFDFGDGTPKVPVPSNIDSAQHAANGYGMITHHYQKPGHYLVRVERRDPEKGWLAVQHLHVVVEP
ncbi:MAG: peptidoglycan DD-metalloendopeptidase family protein [Verrucomicrobia bacterium]|nr:peptidoglycan DD-metalloendopeptidase family protein [Verrucomicrobiota bacterium]